MALTDQELVDGLRRADPAAFDVAFDRYRPRLWGFLLRMGGRTELAEELLQETSLRLAAHGPRLRPDTNLRAWVFTVARNLFRSHRRWAWLDGCASPSSRPGRCVRPGSRHRSSSPPPPRPRAPWSGRWLVGLAPVNREVALLVLVEPMEPAEVAGVLGIRPEAVRQRLARARQAVSAALEGGAR